MYGFGFPGHGYYYVKVPGGTNHNKLVSMCVTPDFFEEKPSATYMYARI
jgi:hypothetical protein